MMNRQPDLLRAASRQSLITFIELAMPHLITGYEHFPYVDLISAKIENLVAPVRSGRLAINLPPRHGKSFILVATIAWYLGTYLHREVLLMTHSQSLGDDLAGKVRKLLQSAFFQEIFPNFRFTEGRESMADFRTSENGGFKAGSFDSGITGRGADLILIDDSLSANKTSSQVARDFVNTTFDTMISTRLNHPKTGAIILMSHRLHENDLSGHLIRFGFEHVMLPFQATEDEAFSCLGVDFRRKAGEVLQPGRLSFEELQSLNIMPDVYTTQYQQDPTAIGSGLLQEHYFPLVDSCPSGGKIIISWDIASSTIEGRSYSVALVFQVMDDVAYLKHIFRERVDYAHLKQHALYLHSLFGPTFHLIESASVGPALIEDLKAAGANVFAINPGGVSKQGRLEAVLNRVIANYLRPVKGIANLKEFFDECMAFPNGTHDDVIDALTQFLKWIPDIPIKPKRDLAVMGAGRLKPVRGGNRHDAMNRIVPKRR